MIFDDLIDKNLFDKLSYEFDASGNLMHIPFKFLPQSARPNEKSSPIDSSWCHILYNGGVVYSDKFEVFNKCFVDFLQKTNQKIKKLHRVRVGLITAQKQNHVHEPHIDLILPHKTALIYLNDSDGDTILYDNFYDNTLGLNSKEYYNKHVKNSLNIQNKIKPKANRVVLFDGYQYHSSSTPMENTYRVVININYFV